VVASDGDLLWVHLNGQTYCLEYRDAVTHLGASAAKAGSMRAPMPGSVIAVGVAPGDTVKAGDMVMVIESMKLETVIRAPADGVVAAVHFGVGDRFDRDAVLVSLEAG
jgi:3-methylcrotonyl-CoA carboxylase alpha subunit